MTSRPALVYGIAKQTRHGNQTEFMITSYHGKADIIEAVLTKVNQVLVRFAAGAGLLTKPERWAKLLRFIFREFYADRPPQAPPAPG